MGYHRRHFLLKIKAKYADGQKIAKKLCKGITYKAKKLLEELNASLMNLLHPYHLRMCYLPFLSTGSVQMNLPIKSHLVYSRTL